VQGDGSGGWWQDGTGAWGGGPAGSGAWGDGVGAWGGSGGSGGAPSANLGAKCTRDTDCADMGLFCLKADANSFLGGGPAGGYCTQDCTQSLIEGSENYCLTWGGSCMNVSLDDARPIGYCVQNCTEGPPLYAGTFGKFDPNKCHGRKDVACSPLYDANYNPIGSACLPLCGTDSQCTKGGVSRRCDPRWGVCSATPHDGLPIGANCEAWLNGGGDAGTDCAGQCTQFLKTEEHSGSDPANIATFCTQTCVFGDLNSCGFKDRNPPAGICIYATSEAGNGDDGMCGEMCDTDGDCLDQLDNAWCDTSTVSNLGRGLCQYNYGRREDAGAAGWGGAYQDASWGD
jgi:hypothetical protein